MTTKSSNSQKVLKGISSQTLVTLLLGVVEIASFSVMSRLLTKEDFGYYAAIMAIVTVFASFSETGIGSAIIQRKELTKKYVDNAFTLSLMFGSFISLLLFLLSGVLAQTIADRSMTKPLMIMSVTLLLHCLTSVFTSIMHRRLEFLRVGGIHLVSLIITTVIAIWLAYQGYGYYAIMTKAVLQSLLIFVMSFVFCKTKFGLAFDLPTVQSIFKFSGWLMASVVFRNLAHQVDKLLMPRLLSISALGAYNRPKDFINQISTKLNGIFDTAMFPVLSSLQDEPHKLQSAFRKSLYILNLFAVLLTLSFVINSELIVRIFLGSEWLELTGIMVVLSLVLVFNIDGRLSDCYLRSMGMTKQQFYFRVFEAVIKIVGVLIGYPWGIMGIAISVVLTNSISKLIKIVYIASKVNITPMETLITIVQSWKFALFLVPACLLIYHILPHNLYGNFFLAVAYFSLTIVIFAYFPRAVGNVYADSVHHKLISTIKSKLHLS